MATRTTVPAVRAIIATALDDNQVVQFIRDASLWVDEELGDSGLSTSRLELIERYLSCALVRLRDLGVKSATHDFVSESYQVDPQVSEYLLRAATFDSTGTLRAQFLAEPTAVRQAKGTFARGFVEQAEEEDA